MKKKFRKKALAAVIAAACSVNGLVVSNFAGSATNDVYEFELGTLSTADRIYTGQDREENPVEASGDSFVFLQDAGETASVEVTVEETGMYNLTIAAYTPYGNKTHNLLVNGVDQGQISFAENKTGFVEVDLGIFKLSAGTNTVTVKSSWGWTYIDYLKVTDASFPSLDAPKVLSDENATDETKRLMCYLRDVYGSHILSGQQEIYMYGPHDFEYEFNYIQNLTGELPAIRGFDYLNECNILYGSEDGTTDRMIDWAKNKGGIITASWHVTVPKDFANFTLGETKIDWSQATYGVWADDAHTVPATDFDTSQILVEGSKEREYWMACLDKLASSIKRLQDENIPIILRPLHEAEGGGGETGSWFFWGQDGSEVYKQLWRLTYDTLVNDYDLHNIIWEWNSYAYETSADWYPGDDYVDLVAYDKYNCTDWSTGQAVLNHNDSAITSTFYTIVEKYGSKKMVAMAENDSIPTLENLTSEKAGWLYFCPWYDGGSDNINFLSNPVFNTQEDLTTMYQSDYCITLDELPEDLYTSYSLEGFGEDQPATEPTEAETTEPVTTDAPDPTEPTETTAICIEPMGALSINNLPEKLEYDADSLEDIDFTDLTVSLDYYHGLDEHDVIYDNVSPLDYPEIFIVDTSEVKRTVPGTYTVTIKCADDVAAEYWVINNEATFEITITGSSQPTIEIGTPSLIGDADLDGKVGVSDVVKTAKFVSSSSMYPLQDAVAAANADVNYDKAINTLDVSKMIEYTLSRITEF
ncbi:MAG: glycosyl hydrolase [Porcipelethomonas sp.]